MFSHLSETLTGGRGAVAAMIRIGEPDLMLSYSGLGNITTLCIGQSGTKRFAVRDGRIKRGHLVLMEAMGGGLTWAAGLVRW